MSLSVYLSGEIHTDWRERIERGAADAGLDVTFSSPVTDHGASDDCGAEILGEAGEPFWRDQLGAGVNAIRTRTRLREADVVVLRYVLTGELDREPSVRGSGCACNHLLS